MANTTFGCEFPSTYGNHALDTEGRVLPTKNCGIGKHRDYGGPNKDEPPLAYMAYDGSLRRAGYTDDDGLTMVRRLDYGLEPLWVQHGHVFERSEQGAS